VAISGKTPYGDDTWDKGEGRARREAQPEVIIFSTREALVETASRLKRAPPEQKAKRIAAEVVHQETVEYHPGGWNSQTGDKVLLPRCLPMPPHDALAVDRAGLRGRLQHWNLKTQFAGEPQVIVIEKSDVGTLACGDANVACDRCPFVCRQTEIVRLRILGHHIGRRVCGSIVDHDDLQLK
jgi:hypothetical protein